MISQHRKLSEQKYSERSSLGFILCHGEFNVSHVSECELVFSFRTHIQGPLTLKQSASAEQQVMIQAALSLTHTPDLYLDVFLHPLSSDESITLAA